jgi:hypothetical protein
MLHGTQWSDDISKGDTRISRNETQSQNCEKRLLASPCLSAPNSSTPTGQISMKFDISDFFFRKSVEKIYSSLQSDKNKGYMRNVSNRSCTENQNIQFMFSNFFSENRTVYEIMSKNMMKPERPQTTIWRMRVPCWISNATRGKAHARAPVPTHACIHQRARAHTHTHTHTHTEIRNSYCFSIATIVTRTPLNVTLRVHCLYCYIYQKS